MNKKDGIIYATLQKGQASKVAVKEQENVVIEDNSNMTMVVFSGDLDKAIAAFIIANGALTMGKKVTMFFTFWGLSILKKKNLSKKSFIEKMFAIMLPKNSQDLPVSKMNFFGIGAKMIRSVMKKKNIMSLEELMKKAKEAGVNITACTMSMDVMGISKEELIDGINYGGVGQYLGETEKSNNNDNDRNRNNGQRRNNDRNNNRHNDRNNSGRQNNNRNGGNRNNGDRRNR